MQPYWDRLRDWAPAELGQEMSFAAPELDCENSVRRWISSARGERARFVWLPDERPRGDTVLRVVAYDPHTEVCTGESVGTGTRHRIKVDKRDCHELFEVMCKKKLGLFSTDNRSLISTIKNCQHFYYCKLSAMAHLLVFRGRAAFGSYRDLSRAAAELAELSSAEEDPWPPMGRPQAANEGLDGGGGDFL